MTEAWRNPEAPWWAKLRRASIHIAEGRKGVEAFERSTPWMVGVMGWAETLMPRLIYVVWFMAFGLLFVGGLTLGTRVDRWRLLLLFVGTFAPLLLEIVTANQVGLFNQGRYFLTGAVGLPLLGAHVLGRRGLPADRLRLLTGLLAVLLLPIHLVCLVVTMDRWDSGLRSLNPYNGSWQPPLGVTLPIVTGAAAVTVLFVVYWLASRTPTSAATRPDPIDAKCENVPV
jgi:hypothetical protein